MPDVDKLVSMAENLVQAVKTAKDDGEDLESAADFARDLAGELDDAYEEFYEQQCDEDDESEHDAA